VRHARVLPWNIPHYEHGTPARRRPPGGRRG